MSTISISSSSRSKNTSNCLKISESYKYDSDNTQDNIFKFEQDSLFHVRNMIRNSCDPNYELPGSVAIGGGGGSSSYFVSQPTQEQTFDIFGEVDIGIRISNDNIIRFIPVNGSVPLDDEKTSFTYGTSNSISTTYTAPSTSTFPVTVNYSITASLPYIINIDISVTGTTPSPALITYSFPYSDLITFISNSLTANPEVSGNEFLGFGPEVPVSGATEITFTTPTISSGSYSSPVNITGDPASTTPGYVERGYSFGGTGVQGGNNIVFTSLNMNQVVQETITIPPYTVYARLFTEHPDFANIEGPNLDFYTKFLIRDPSATDGVLPQVTECESVIKQIAKATFEALRKSSNYISEYNNQDELCNTSSSALNNKGQGNCGKYCIDIKLV